MKQSLRFFIDFDGTVTTQDAVDLVLDRFAADEWKDIEKEWSKGKIGSRECLTRQMALVSATRQEIVKLADTIAADPGFVSFLRTLKSLSVPAVIVSDGFDVIIQTILKNILREEPALLKALTVYSNRLSWVTERKVKPFFLSSTNACVHGCANCKVRAIEKIKTDKDCVVFVGDGLSDRFAAAESDVVFAKKSLLEFCREKNLSHRPYESFRDIEDWVLAQSKNWVKLRSVHAV